MAEGMTVKEMILDTNARVIKLDEKLDTVIVEHVERFGRIEARVFSQETKFDIYIRDRTALIGLGSSVVASIIVLYVAMFMPGCVKVPSPITDLTPTAVPVETATLTATTVPTWTPTPEPTSTATATDTPTPDWAATPTMITPTGSIIEVTPIGGSWSTAIPKIELLHAVYAPRARQNVRLGPGVDYPVKYRLSGGQTVQVYAWLSDLPFEAWLCLDKPVDGEVLCNEAIALVLEGKEFGEIDYD